MDVEILIKELLDEISDVLWTPGTYPLDLTQIVNSPAAAWIVTTGSGISTSSDREAVLETSVTISLWTGDADTRASVKETIRQKFTGCGFLARLPSDTQVKLPDQNTAYVSILTFSGWIDMRTYWVYQSK